jgi:hydrogenase maturation protease
MNNRNRLAILGVGNVLCTDDGIGPAAVERLSREFDAPDGVAILDGGTLGLSLLHIIEESDEVIIVDAIRMDSAPGTLVSLEGDEVLPAVRLRLSVHQVGVADLLDAARLRGRLPGRLILLGIVPESIELGFGLSPSASSAMPSLVDAIVRQTELLGVTLVSRTSHATMDLDSPRDCSARMPQEPRPRPAGCLS